ncbi:MAG: hypothetical protein R3A80_03565 [Bdellovibrionota bacterium]
MIIRHKIKYLALLLLFVNVFMTNQSFSSDICVNILRKFKNKQFQQNVIAPLGGFVLAAIVIGVPATHHDREAKKEGKLHLGNAIYLDMHKIIEQTPRRIRKLLEDPINNTEEIVLFYNSQLYGDYTEGDPKNENIFPGFIFAPSARNASEFFKGCSKDRGVCRHKAKILHGILTHFGINAILVQTTTPKHLWVELPDNDLAADPTNLENKLIKTKDYYKFLKNNNVDLNTKSISKQDPYQSTGLLY